MKGSLNHHELSEGQTSTSLIYSSLDKNKKSESCQRIAFDNVIVPLFAIPIAAGASVSVVGLITKFLMAKGWDYPSNYAVIPMSLISAIPLFYFSLKNMMGNLSDFADFVTDEELTCNKVMKKIPTVLLSGVIALSCKATYHWQKDLYAFSFEQISHRNDFYSYLPISFAYLAGASSISSNIRSSFKSIYKISDWANSIPKPVNDNYYLKYIKYGIKGVGICLTAYTTFVFFDSGYDLRKTEGEFAGFVYGLTSYIPNFLIGSNAIDNLVDGVAGYAQNKNCSNSGLLLLGIALICSSLNAISREAFCEAYPPSFDHSQFFPWLSAVMTFILGIYQIMSSSNIKDTVPVEVDKEEELPIQIGVISDDDNEIKTCCFFSKKHHMARPTIQSNSPVDYQIYRVLGD